MVFFFFFSEKAEDIARKAGFEVCEELFLTQKRNPSWNKSLPVGLWVSVMQALFSSHVGCFYQLMVCSRGHGKTNK